MAFIEKIVDFLSQYELGLKYLEIVADLTPAQIEIIVLVTLLLFLFILYRKFGAPIFWVSLMIIFIGYIVYKANIGDFYEQQNADYDNRMRDVQKEIDKDIRLD